jgi:ribitol-5-phosphate 2-dehydrogenase
LINCIYQLISPKIIDVKFQDIDFSKKVLIRPRFMSVCHADLRYYNGKRKREILEKKLPMALIHECCGVVLRDETLNFPQGTNVVMIPNDPPSDLKPGIFENYAENSKFLSSGSDGFMQEFIVLNPDRVVPFNFVEETVFCISELVSVAVHAVNRFINCSHKNREKIAVFGDGSVGFLVSLILKKIIPDAFVILIGKHTEKIRHFSFVDDSFIELHENFKFDHAFECIGNQGSSEAIDKIINHIRPQGTVILMGVSEEKIAVNTRNILEKGLTFIGSSRSGRKDFETAVEFLENEEFRNRVSSILSFEGSVNKINDIHKIFEKSLTIPFKLAFKWNL